MTLVKRVRSRGANMLIEAHGEVLFAPEGPGTQFARSFSNRLRAFASAYAPSNKRPRWAHYGKPLKQTMRASSKAEPAQMRAFAVIGSTAPHSAYVDQGTGIYGGSGPYPAKILPPWTHGGSSLYESSWRFSGNYPVMIRGQRSQHFFDRAINSAFAAAHMAHTTQPRNMSGSPESAVNHLDGFTGNTLATPAFVAQLKQWRAWRDAAWDAKRSERSGTRLSNGRKSQGRDLRRARTLERKQAQQREASKRYRTRHPDRVKKTTKSKASLPKNTAAAQIAARRAAFIQRVTGRYPSSEGYKVTNIHYVNGKWEATVTSKSGKSHTVRDKNG